MVTSVFTIHGERRRDELDPWMVRCRDVKRLVQVTDNQEEAKETLDQDSLTLIPGVFHCSKQ